MEKWTQTYDGGSMYDHMTTNLTEFMNYVLKGSTIVRQLLKELDLGFLNEGRRQSACYKLTINIQKILLPWYKKMNNSLLCVMSKCTIDKIHSLMFKSYPLPNYDTYLCHAK